MTKQEQIKELQEQVRKIKEQQRPLWERWASHDYDSKEFKKIYKEIKKLEALTYEPIYQIEVLKGVVYHEEKWITEITSDLCDSLEEARKNLLEKLSKLDGVKVINDKSGIKLIEVLTKNKVYHYEIHGHYISHQVGEKMGERVSLFKKEQVIVPIYVTKFRARCGKNVFNAFRGEYYWED